MPVWLLANKKIIAQAGVLVTLLVGLYQLHDSVYESGIKDCRSEASRVFNEQVLKLQADTAKQVQAALDLQTLDHAKDIERAKKERVIVTQTEVLKEYVTNTIEVPAACDVVASDVVGVLVKATNIVNGATTSRDTETEN